MFMSVGKSILNCFSNDPSNIAILLNDLDMQESLSVSDTLDTQIVQIDAKCVWERKKVDVQVTSGEGRSKKVHCKATIIYGDRKHEQKILSQSHGSASSLIAGLKSEVMTGATERFSLAMAYRMVASLAYYHPSHQGVKECFLNSTTLEASSLVSLLPQNRLPGPFALDPCMFDGVLSLATFVLNANDSSQFDKEVYVVRGWDSVFLDRTLTADQEYETYVRMVAKDKDTSVGDIAITHKNTLIGSIRGVRVQRVPRRLMDAMFKPKGASQAPQASTVTRAAPAPKPVVKEAPVYKAPTPAPKPVDSGKTQKALAIVAEESGLDLSELKDGDLLADLGIDSLLIL
jgi:iterative type I PKS product template protein